MRSGSASGSVASPGRSWRRITARPVTGRAELAAFIATRLDHVRRPPRVLHEPIFHTEMAPSRWPVPRIDTVGELAERLELDPGQLAWLADVKGLERRADEQAAQLHLSAHPAGERPPRVLERPKLRLKEIQRWILRELLVWIPPHDAAHGFVGGPLGPHARRPAHRPPGGPPRSTSRTSSRPSPRRASSASSAPRAIRRPSRTRSPGCARTSCPSSESSRAVPALAPARDAAPAQGAPTSPALANLVAFQLDAGSPASPPRSARATPATPTTSMFSADHYLRPPHDMIATIAREEGFRVERGARRA